jgi:hypothetical protein
LIVARYLHRIYIIKEFVQPKMSLKREFLIWKERGRGESEGVREKKRGRQADIFKVRLGLGEIDRYRRGERQRYREIERHRNKET